MKWPTRHDRSALARLGGRSSTYTIIMVSVLTLLVSGLVLPLALGHSPAPSGGTSGFANLQGSGPSQALVSPSPGGGLAPSASARSISPSPRASQTTNISDSSPTSVNPFGEGQGGPAKPSGDRLASDQGITADSVKIGILLVSFGNANQLGAGVSGYDPDKQKTYYAAYINAVNAGGGVFGRKIDPVYYTVDILSPATFTAACQTLVDSDHVFAVMNVLGVYGSGILCFTQQKATPFLAVDGAISSYYRDSNGLLFTLGPSTLATNKNAIDSLAAVGEFTNHKVGLVNEGDYLTADFNSVSSYLNSVVGYNAPHTTIAAVDTTQAARDIPAAVTQMRTAGVDYVLLQTNSLYAQEFVSDAADQGYYPAYGETDFDYEMAGNSFLKNLPARYFDHAVSVTSTRVGDANAAISEGHSAMACRRTYEQANGVVLDQKSDEYYAALSGCGLVRLLVDGLQRAGLNPTRPAFSAGVQRIGASDYAGLGSASFVVGRFTAPGSVRIDRADGACHCWLPVGSGAFHPVRYKD